MNDLRPWTRELRLWQQRAFSIYREVNRLDFLMVATPGSGKTFAALRIAHKLLSEGDIARIVVVVPSSHLRIQWTEAAHEVGINLDPEWENQHGHETADFHGIVVTYQSVASSPLLHCKNCDPSDPERVGRPTLVILDEIHHAGDDRGWGKALLSAFKLAARRLCLSGTPFRSDQNRIPFVHYEDGRSVSRPPHGFSYGYEDSLKDPGVIRAILFPHYEGEMEWISDGFECAATFADKLDERGQSQRLRTALSTEGDWLRCIIREANEKLHEVRRAGHDDAAGLVLAMDQPHARLIADLMRDLSRENIPGAAQLADPLVVTSDDAGASGKIAGFRNDSRPWVIAVRMISEGVDIRRLRVGVYASNVITELFFRQVVGRFVRWLPGLREQTAYLYIPADERLVAFAREVQKERDHFIEAAAEEGRSPLVSADDIPSDPIPPGFFMPVGASDAEPQGMIHDSTVLPHSEIAEAKTLLAEMAGLVPEHLLVKCYQRAREHFQANPAEAMVETQPAKRDEPPEQMQFRARDAEKAKREGRVRSFVGLIMKTCRPEGAGYGDIVQKVNRKLKDYSGYYVDGLTIRQIQEQNEMLLRWSNCLQKAAREQTAPGWLESWEAGQQ